MTRSKSEPIVFRILPALLVAAWCATALAAAPSPEGEGREWPAPEAAFAELGTEPSTAGASRMRVFIDPKTGEIVSVPARESRALSEALENALSRSTEGLEVFDLPAGGKGVHLEGRFQHVMTVRVKADGSLEFGCVDSARKAKDLLHGKAVGSDDASRDR